MSTIQHIALSAIQPDKATQIRAEINHAIMLEYAERVGSIALAVRTHRAWALGTSFLGALSRVVRVKEFDDAHFIKKVNTWVSLLNHEPLAVQDFIEMIEKIYNRSVRSPIPIKFLADQSSRARCAVPGAKKAKSAS